RSVSDILARRVVAMIARQHLRGYERLLRAAILMGLASAAMTAASVKLKRGQDQIEVIIGGHPFTTYYFLKDVVKPYLMPLETLPASLCRGRFLYGMTFRWPTASSPTSSR